MPRSKWPLAQRTKAMRSRCAGSILAWILNTTPLNLGSTGSTTRWMAALAPGCGARSTSASSTSRTPKLLTAEPNSIGVCVPCRKASLSKAGEAPSTSSISSLAALHSMPKRSALAGLSMPASTSSSPPRRSSPAANTRIWSSRRSYTPRKVLPMPTGQVKGTTVMPSSRSISSIRSSGAFTSRSILLTKVMMGVLRERQTCSRRRVCGSTPLPASITMSAASTAVSTR